MYNPVGGFCHVFSGITFVTGIQAKEMCPTEQMERLVREDEEEIEGRQGKETDQSRNRNRVVVLVLYMSNLSLLCCERRYL
jgi:hypothetical protein